MSNFCSSPRSLGAPQPTVPSAIVLTSLCISALLRGSRRPCAFEYAGPRGIDNPAPQWEGFSVCGKPDKHRTSICEFARLFLAREAECEWECSILQDLPAKLIRAGILHRSRSP